jgi:hypothetical protein
MNSPWCWLKKGIVVITIEEKTSPNIVVHWNEFIELFKIEKNESQNHSQRGFNHTLTNFEGSSGFRLTKKQKRKKLLLWRCIQFEP